MEGKKISFGFMKTKKADKPLAVSQDEKKDYIECVEEKSIKIVGGEEIQENAPLIIPMKPNTLVTAERLKEIAVKVESEINEPEIKQEPSDNANIEQPVAENETLEQMAVRELMQEAKKEIKTESREMAIPAAMKTAPEGEKESTLDDYEAVPIQEFGMAMLRGMGWTPSKDGSKYKLPELRPKGLGLGADKVVKQKKKDQGSKDSKGEELSIVINSFVKITNGKHNGYYGKVISLDEDNGRVMVDIAVKKETVSLSEFMMHPVTKSEYDKESKVINADSFEEYKKNETSQKSSKQESKSSSSHRRDEKEIERREDRRQKETDSYDRRQRDSESANGRSKNRQRRDSSSSEERYSRQKKKEKKRYSSTDSLSSLSEDDRRQHKHSKHKSRRRRSRSRSNSRKKSRTPEGKRDIDKKRKGKKKKRDRDRSPNYKKHRK